MNTGAWVVEHYKIRFDEKSNMYQKRAKKLENDAAILVKTENYHHLFTQLGGEDVSICAF